MSDYPSRWFEKLSMVQSRPDLLTGVEMLVVINFGHTLGPPNEADAAMIERVFDQMTKETADGHEA